MKAKDEPWVMNKELVAESITKKYGRKTVLEGVDLVVGPGIHGLLGNNGAGKSTLIKILATVIPASHGVVRYGQFLRPRQDHQIRQCLGYLPQQYGLLEHLTPREYLSYAARMKGGSPHDERFSPDYWLHQVGLEAVAGRGIRGLSGGMKQRLAIAQAMMGDPSLLILDEPTAGLDPDERVRFRNLIQEYGREATVLLSTHIVSDVEHMAQQITIMHQGHIVAAGPPQELADRARGRLYEVTLSTDDWEVQRAHWMDRHRSPTEGVVAGIIQESGGVRIRLVSDAPPPTASPVLEPGLEDGYLVCTTLGLRP